MALYRKYRPASFAEVVGQEHVTEPLSRALDSGQINHAYLFSGPRGCGKTSSARILARSLNCVEGPTSTPCGKCDSCVALAPGGSGTLDVTELDAATHNGVDDMRELRDRAFYAPAESRYRVFIVDEAHMISKEGFNALLKIVEEPPEHLIFIFATTEPEKMLATIRSRTHNYPFRLLAPPAMRGLLERVVAGEGKKIEDAVYPLVVRAGGGSPRDSLSLMDQLLAGAGPEGVTYQRALALLGVTDAALIDKAVEALAEQDQASLFGVVDDVIDAGYEPRRFATDLLDRFRDLLIIKAVPDAFERGLVDAPAGAQEVLTSEAQALGQATITRCAALVNEGLSQMRGATAPRLLLEILCARMALPAAGMTVESLAQRVEALEKRQTSPSTEQQQTPISSGRKYERPSKAKAAAQEESKAEPVATQTPEAAPTPEPAKAEAPAKPEPAPTPEPQEDPVIAEARRAREIMDRNRQPEPMPNAQRDPAEEWTQLLALTKESNLSAWIAARDAKPAEEQPNDDELHVLHHTGALAKFVNSEANQKIYAAAAEKAVGKALKVVASTGKAEAAPSGIIPQETGLAPQELRNSSNSALARARAMTEAYAQPKPNAAPSATSQPKAPAEAEKPTSRWKARAQKYRSEQQHALDNGFDGVPLPPEPPAEEWDETPAEPQEMPADEASVASKKEEDELLEQIDEGPGEADHRKPLDIAGELVEKHLGGQRLR